LLLLLQSPERPSVISATRNSSQVCIRYGCTKRFGKLKTTKQKRIPKDTTRRTQTNKVFHKSQLQLRRGRILKALMISRSTPRDACPSFAVAVVVQNLIKTRNIECCREFRTENKRRQIILLIVPLCMHSHIGPGWRRELTTGSGRCAFATRICCILLCMCWGEIWYRRVLAPKAPGQEFLTG